MPNFKIDKDVPLPVKTFPFAELEVGESFLFVGGESTIRNAAYFYNRAHSKSIKISRRHQDKHGETGYRAWRIA